MATIKRLSFKRKLPYYSIATILVLGGILLCVFSSQVNEVFNFVFACIILSCSILSLILYFLEAKYREYNFRRLMQFGFLLIIGLAVLFLNGASAVICILWGFWSILKAAAEAQALLSHKERTVNDIFKLMVVIAVFVLGIVLLLSYNKSVAAHIIVLGISLILHGLSYIFNMVEWSMDTKYKVDYGKVVARNITKEALGFLTVFNFERSLSVKSERRISYSDDDNLYLNFHYPKKRDNSPLPVFVYIHGGGWVTGLPENREAFTTKIAHDGFFVVNVFYGLAPSYTHPDQIENIYKAFAWIVKNKINYNLDLENLFVGGESAGAHLASMAGAISTNPDYNLMFNLCEESRYLKIKGLALNCGVYDIGEALGSGFGSIDFYVQSYLGKPFKKLSDDETEQISPLNYVTKNYPPSFIISAEHDHLAVCSDTLISRLANLGVPYGNYFGRGAFAIHAFAVAMVLKISKEAMKGIKLFLNELVNKK